MDNEKIHIDDLVRGKLSGREEDERAGAWLNMRELLDKNMPAGQVAGGGRARRIVGYVALLSLLTAATVGGYQVMNRQGAGERNEAGRNGMITEGRISGSTGRNVLLQEGTEGRSVSGRNLSDDHLPHDAGYAGSGGRPQAAEAVVRPSGTITGSGTSAERDAGAIRSAQSGESVAGSGTDAERKIAANRSAEPENTNAGSGADAKQEDGSVHSDQSGNAAGPVMNAKQKVAAAHPAESENVNAGPGMDAERKNEFASLRDSKDSGSLSVFAKEEEASGSQQKPVPVPGGRSGLQGSPAVPSGRMSSAPSQPVASYGEPGALRSPVSAGSDRQPVRSRETQVTAAGKAVSGASAKTAAGTGSGQMSGKSGHSSYMLRHDTLARINLVYRTIINPLTRAKHTKLDTASVSQIVVERKIPVPVPDLPAQAAHGKGRKPGIGMSSASAEGEQQALGSAAAVKARQKRLSNQQRFDDMLLNARINLSQMQFYPGITGGINAMFSGGTFIPGFQLGFQGEMVFNDRWAVMTELRYITRFSNGKTIEDNYVGGPVYRDSLFQGGNLVSRVYTRDSVAHSYNFSTLGTLNLPVSLRYSVRKFFMAAGIDLAYHFRINAEEVSGAVQLRDTLSASAGLPASWKQGDKTVSLEDLRGRFGIGYLIGAGYRVNPNLHLDLRMTQMFWDNAGNGGAAKVSDQLFRMPGFQLSVGYRLGGRVEP